MTKLETSAFRTPYTFATWRQISEAIFSGVSGGLWISNELSDKYPYVPLPPA